MKLARQELRILKRYGPLATSYIPINGRMNRRDFKKFRRSITRGLRELKHIDGYLRRGW